LSSVTGDGVTLSVSLWQADCEVSITLTPGDVAIEIP
jgi:hypothetical protein